MSQFKRLYFLSLLLAPLLGLVAHGSAAQAAAPARFAVIGSYRTGLADGTGDRTAAETVAYGEGRIYLTNSTDNSLDIVDVSDPSAPALLKRVSLAAYGAGPNSVAFSDGVVAVAVEASPKTDPGAVVFLDAEGAYLNRVKAGALPDMLTFTPNGRLLLVANEGEPSNDYQLDPVGSISAIRIGDEGVSALNDDDVITIGFASFDASSLRAQGVRIFGPGASAAQDLEPEYITVTQNNQLAFVSLQENNAVAVVDLQELRATRILPLGFKNHLLAGQGLDPSDRDGAIKIAPWPVYGMYQPDALDTYEVRGRTYFVTANEGNARDYNPGLREEATVSSLALDPTTFPNASALKANAALGRLTVTRMDGDTDGDGDYDRLYAFGARSFSIWDAAGQQVYDSGDSFEQRVAQAQPANFNANNSSNAFDNRSDNKGPEPEGVSLGKLGGRTYAFIGLEREGGVMIFDVSEPSAPSYVQYLNSRNFAVAPGQTDSGPEVVVFVKEGPDDRPLILLANEVSGSITLIQPVE